MIQISALLILASALTLGFLFAKMSPGGPRLCVISWTLASTIPVFLVGVIIPYLSEHPDLLSGLPPSGLWLAGSRPSCCSS